LGPLRNSSRFVVLDTRSRTVVDAAFACLDQAQLLFLFTLRRLLTDGGQTFFAKKAQSCFAGFAPVLDLEAVNTKKCKVRTKMFLAIPCIKSATVWPVIDFTWAKVKQRVYVLF
jgi:hypothetical protein